MQVSLSIVSLLLATSASAAPVNGKNQNGSIYRFGNADECNKIFRQYGACGISTYFKNVDPKATLVAMPSDVFDKHGKSQNNKMCGKTITMTRNGVTRKAVVADRNVSNDKSIDMCLDLWKAFGGKDNDGTLLRGFSWSMNI